MTAAVQTVTRLNLGCGGYPLDGYTNLDLYPPADIVGDFMQMEFTGLEEVAMIHSLEHLPWVETPQILTRIKGWLAPGGTLRIEVPDMEAIMAMGTAGTVWNQYVYGCQAHEGEYHKAGFTEDLLAGLLELVGYRIVSTRRFVGGHPMREGFPNLEVVACV